MRGAHDRIGQHRRFWVAGARSGGMVPVLMEPNGPAVGLGVVDGVSGLPVVEVEMPADAAAPLRDDTFVEFYRLSRDRIARGLALTLGDVHLGAEAADEAMARAFQRWDQVEACDEPAAWVYRVGLNWATSLLTRRRRSPSALAEPWSDEMERVAEPAITAALAELPVGQRSVIVCRYYLGMSEAETAAALDTRPGTVKSRLHRGLHELQGRLAHLRTEDFG